MKTAIVLLLLLSSTVHAADLELSLGGSANTTNMAYSIGLTGLASSNLRWRVGLASLGTPSYTANAALTTPDDVAAGEGPGPFNLMSPKNETEIYATLAPEIHRGDWTFSVEGGFGLYRPNSLWDLAGSNPAANTSLALTPIIGASIGFGKTSVVFSLQHMMTRADVDSGPTFSNRQSTISLRHMF